MYATIIKAIGFIVMILIGMFSRRVGLVTIEEGKAFGKIIMNFTLPCSLIYGFSSVQFDMMMLLALAFGFLLSYAGMLVGRCLYRNRTALEMAGGMLCCSGYNIANFAIPFCQSFFPIAATGYLGMFDVGNCIMCLGGTNAFAEMALHGTRKVSLRQLCSNLLHSVPFMVYLILIGMSLVRVPFPAAVLDIVGMIAPANIFLIMFMVGTQVNFGKSAQALRAAFKLLGIRFLMAAVFAAVLSFTALPALFKQVMMIAPFSPISSPTVIYVQQNGCDMETAAAASTLSILFSILCYVLIIMTLI